MSNHNVLADYACPKCGSEGPFNIHGEALFLNVDDDGCSDFECFSWNPDSGFRCNACGLHDKALAFYKGD